MIWFSLGWKLIPGAIAGAGRESASPGLSPIVWCRAEGCEASALLKRDASTVGRFGIVVSSMDSGLEAFSHNPTDGGFAALAFRPTANTNYLNQQVGGQAVLGRQL